MSLVDSLVQTTVIFGGIFVAAALIAATITIAVHLVTGGNPPSEEQ